MKNVQKLSKIISLIIITCFLTLGFYSCDNKKSKDGTQTENKQSGLDGYIGLWKIEKVRKNGLVKFEITKNGDDFIFQGIGHDFFLGQDYKAVLKKENGNLFLTGVPTMGNVDLTLMDNGSSILFMGKTFKKIR